jgi:predicted metal-dependent hydrolase
MAKKPGRALDHVVVHELTRLVVRHHGERFQSLMDRHMPKWRFIKSELRALPLAHDSWT